MCEANTQVAGEAEEIQSNWKLISFGGNIGEWDSNNGTVIMAKQAVAHSEDR